MSSLRITAPDGTVRNVPLRGPEVTLGRLADNAIVLEGNGVSSHHCAFLIQGAQVVVQDRGSTNGTFVNNAPTQTSTPLSEEDRIYVGQYLLQVVHGAVGVTPHALTAPHAAGSMPMQQPSGPGARILMQREDRGWRDEHNRLQRYAEQWDQAGRPDRLALRPHELRSAQAWLAQTDADRQHLITVLQRELIEGSKAASRRRSVKRAASLGGSVLLLGGVVAAAVMLWPEGDDASTETTEQASTETETKESRKKARKKPQATKGPSRDDERIEIKEEIEHQVIPEETLDDIAQRYGVTVNQLADWNLLNPDAPDLKAGDIVKVKKPTKRPLPQQRINYELEREDTSWSSLAKRFGVSVKKLRAYNSEVDKLTVGQAVVIWVDPKPYAPKEPRQAIPAYVPDETAQSVGSPNAGSLVNGVQMPESPLYKRRRPYLMWGSGYLVANLQTAVAQFRQDMDFDGTLVLADISKQRGGHFNPHKSHQAGRDIDIWLPTLRGVFKEKYLTEDGDEAWGRRPNPEEVDWFATWGFVRALIKTGAVQNIFLDHTVQPNVYNAAKFLGISDEELDESIQYPRSKGSPKGVLSHSDAHIHHMHVRFKCARYEKDCNRRVSAHAE